MKTVISVCASILAWQLASSMGAMAASNWIDTQGAAMRVISAPPGPDGVVRGILEITLEPGWKTYWRDPGDGGIPPSLTVKADGKAIPLLFPVPERIKEKGLNFLGYHAAVAFPFTLDAPAKDVTLEAFVGVCSDICVPFQADFELDALARHVPRIDRAFETLPREAAVGEGIVSARIAGGMAEFTSPDPAEQLFLAPAAGLVLGEPVKTEIGFSAPVLRDDGAASSVFFTLNGPSGALSGEAKLLR